MGIADLAGESTLEAAILIISDEASAGACVIQLPKDSALRFESIGRDEDGGFLISDDGALIRLQADEGELDNLLGKDNVMIEELDEHGIFVDAYPVTPMPFGSNSGYRA